MNRERIDKMSLVTFIILVVVLLIVVYISLANGTKPDLDFIQRRLIGIDLAFIVAIPVAGILIILGKEEEEEEMKRCE